MRTEFDDYGRVDLSCGDLDTGHFEEGVVRAGQILNRPVWIMAFGGCPFGLDMVATSSENCAQSNEATAKWLSKAPPGVVTIANAAWVLTTGHSSASNSEKVTYEISSSLVKIADSILESEPP